MKKLELINNSDKIITIADYICNKQSEIESSYKICPKELSEISLFLRKIIDHDNDFIIAIYSDKRISGVGCFLNEPSEKYLECLGGFFDDKSDFIMAMNYLKDNFQGHHIDFVLPIENKKLLEYLKNENAIFENPEICLEISINNIVQLNEMEEIKELSKEHFAGYRRIHNDKDRYWTAERVLERLDIFKPYIVIIDGEVIGYIDVTYGGKLVEIYDLKILSEYNKFIEPLINIAAHKVLNKDNKLMVLIGLNDSIIEIYKKIGFAEKDISQAVSLTLINRGN
ncbi:MAG: hypothetical protein LBI14_02475 [Treponema sp.]|jgi:hypothetical protein|nr:hypothetical protein [Treponema sp.]